MACCSSRNRGTRFPKTIQEKGPKVGDNSATTNASSEELSKEKSKQSPEIVWTIGSPIWKEETWEPPKYLKGKHFTQVCAMCKKDIPAYDDVYMYGYMQAFCSDDCREDKIAFDRVFGPTSPKTKESNDYSMMNLARPAAGGGTKASTMNRSKRLYKLAE